MRWLALLTSVGLLALPAAALADAAVEVRSTPSSSFSPTAVSIAAGEKVTWTWVQSGNHSVTPSAGYTEPPDSDPGNSFPFHAMGFTYEHTFNSAGCFRYQCKVHGTMRGTVSVGGASCTSQPPPPGGTAPPPPGSTQPPTYGTPPTTGGTTDTVPPSFRSLRARPSAICVERSAECRRPGLLLSFRLSEAASIAARIELLRAARGAARTVRRMRFRGRAGANRRRISGRGLRAGSYRLTMRAEDAAGNDAKLARVRFRVKG